MDVVVIGSALVDVIIKTTGDFKLFTKDLKKYLSVPYGSKIEVNNLELHAGGSGHNVATDLASFGHKVNFVGKVGDDYLGDQIVRNFKKEGVNIKNLKIVRNGKSGFSIIFLSPSGEKSIMVYNGCNLDLNVNDVPGQDIKNSKWLVFTSVTSKTSLKFLRKATELARKNNVKVLVNPSIRMIILRKKELLEFIKNSDITIMNEKEINELMKNNNTILSMKKLNKLGAKLVVVTLGIKGAIAYDGNKIYRQKGFRVKIIDSTGCGDSFTAGFLHYILKGKNINEALKFANANAALEIEDIGSASLPEKKVLDFISKH
jgi:ribokinase